MDFQIPDAVGEPIMGYRTWFVVPREKTTGELVLRSFVYSEIWEPHEPHKAACRIASGFKQVIHTSGVPEEMCNCGIYAGDNMGIVNHYYESPDYTPGSWREIYRVYGEVALWGKVIKGEKGTRAEYAYPTKLLVPEHIRGRESLLSVKEIVYSLEKYGVPIEVTEENLDLRKR